MARTGLALAIGATVAFMAAFGLGYEARAQEAGPDLQSTSGEAVGATTTHPASWSVDREPYTFDKTYGYTLWRTEGEDGHDHGGAPAARVALAYGMRPGGIEAVLERTSAEYPDGEVRRERVSVGRFHEGEAIGPIPGSTPATRVFVPVNGRVYRIDVYAERPGEEGLDADDRAFLESVRFERPSRSVESLEVSPANSIGALTAPVDPELERAASSDDPAGGSGEAETAGSKAVETKSGTGETRIDEGCWRAPPDFFVQVQHGRGASARDDDGIPTGYSRAGSPNYWNEYTHGNLGYGRCTEPDWTNDMYAVDYRLNRGDFIYSPFRCGRVTFAGQNTTHRDYGIFVVVRSCNGKYASLSAHLDSIDRRVLTDPGVNRKRVIGYAGNTDGPYIDAGPVHLHQAFYRYPTYHRDGSPYGGQGLQVKRLRYFRGEGGTHVFGFERTARVKAKGSLVVN